MLSAANHSADPIPLYRTAPVSRHCECSQAFTQTIYPRGFAVPTPTPDEIRDAAAQSAADGISSAEGDQGSATAMDPVKQIEAAEKLEAKQALAGSNPQGGAKSGWRTLRPARAELPGAN